MSDVVNGAVAALNQKLGSFDSTAKFIIEGEGSIIIDENGARPGDEAAEVTLTASRETFEGILDGTTNATMAYMSGKLKVDGDLPVAMKLGAALS
ncbi:SCP2 sterol-binding domain-containing protein [uncultured Paracoccus sp.]|uniref:SCP2 sterol-binding domain-containing protein n=1 Tax=uncultured Paracoccus sp. TaxID=189685 RepID=UPI002612D183|nr:SCP2 sterol-binding domain-containing protein [uncultured Paracoccus sp.]